MVTMIDVALASWAVHSCLGHPLGNMMPRRQSTLASLPQPRSWPRLQILVALIAVEMTEFDGSGCS
eukprot:1092899-Karenia_brevis.AAC.1